MTTREHPPTNSQLASPAHPRSAEPAHTPPGSGAPRVVARKGVLSAVRPDPERGDGRYPIAWLHVTAPGGGAIPTATSKCLCGRDRSAVGHRKVLALIEDHHAHRTVCSWRRSGAAAERKAA